eukprot:gb/GECG01013445.1/.p1 GENE.gb/GECG01013445.1/~~gb/GECG01013445.1/.p1  ORF type:complete len:721 (+),score=51.77 gb/GECG01013445.1/:1-2163(+)
MSLNIRRSEYRTGYLINKSPSLQDQETRHYTPPSRGDSDHTDGEYDTLSSGSLSCSDQVVVNGAYRTPETEKSASRNLRSRKSSRRNNKSSIHEEEGDNKRRRSSSVSKKSLPKNGGKRRGMSVPRMRTTLQSSRNGSENGASPAHEEPSKEEAEANTRRKPSLEGEYGNLFILLVLYILQGIPMGLAMSVPLMLKEKGFGFTAKGQFSMAGWPYGMKLLWAPIVDAIYSPSIGRRKSWVIPVQFLTGVMMIWLGSEIDSQFAPDSRPNVTYLASIFFILYFLVATQDIAVDGWALTMLRPENVGYASTCNSVGQQIGFLTSYALFMAFNSPDFCNRWLRTEETKSNEGVISMGQFMYFWGIVFILATTIIGIIKKEDSQGSTKMGADNYRSPEQSSSQELLAGGCSEPVQNIRTAYARIIQVVTLPHVLILMLVLVTCRFPFAGIDGGFDLELMEKGIPKDQIAMLGVTIITPLELLTTTFVSKLTSGPKPLSVFLYTFPVRIALGFIIIFVLESADFSDSAKPPFWFYVFALSVFGLYRCCANVMFVAQMAFFNRVSDPSIGGTYMTLLNTLSNIGGMWAVPLVLRTMDSIETHNCQMPGDNSQYTSLQGASCEDPADRQRCVSTGGSCVEVADGFIPMVLVTLATGCIWWIVMRRKVLSLETTPVDDWRVGNFDNLPRWARWLIRGQDKEREQQERDTRVGASKKADRHARSTNVEP